MTKLQIDSPPGKGISFLTFFNSLDPARKLILLGLGFLSIGLVAGMAWYLLQTFKIYKLTLVAGSKDGESYVLSQAIKQVVEAQNSKIRIEVVETSGTSENLKLLEAGKAELATAQADVPGGASVRTVIILYPDVFQLVVKDTSKIKQFTDLKSKRIGLWKKGGQYRSFLDIAAHYGLQESNFIFVGENQEESNQAFRQNQVDAIFRVRALGNKTIADLVEKHRGRLAAIEQGAAMRIKYPAFEPSVIPKGAYRGSSPAVPGAELPTVIVNRLLVASDRVDSSIIKEITAILDSRRQEIANKIPAEFADVRPLVSLISKPTTTGGTGMPIHPGAIAYFERDKPPFIKEYAPALGFTLTLMLLFWSWLWELKAWLERRRKDEADIHIEAVIRLMTAVQENHQQPNAALGELDQIFARAAKDLIEEKISQESFRTISEAYKAVRDAIEYKGKRDILIARKSPQLSQ